MAKIHDVLTGQALGSVVNIFTLTAVSCAMAAGIILAVWSILDDRVDIAVPDDALALIKHDPNPPMMAWRPRIPDGVGASSFTITGTTGGALVAACTMPGGAIVSTSSTGTGASTSSMMLYGIPCELNGAR